MTEIECFPDPSCRCCVCVGFFCNTDHPGHWHGSPCNCCVPWKGVHAKGCIAHRPIAGQ